MSSSLRPSSPVPDYMLFLLTVFALSFYAFYNGYPLLFPDTGTHIFSGFEKYVPDDRPIAYGLFIRYVSMGEILWLVVIAQAILMAWMLRQIVRKLLPEMPSGVVVFFLVMVLIAFTGLSFHVSQILPDVFTSLCLLSLIYLMMAGTERLLTKVLVALLFIFSVIVHNSHLIIATLLLLIFAFLLFLKRRSPSCKRYFSNLPVCAALVLACWLLIPAINYSFGKGFKVSYASHIFLMNRMVENGILDQYLKDNCGKKDLKICTWKDSIPTNFVWDYANSPIYKMGGWEATRKEYNDIIKETLTKPKYLKMHIHKGLESIFVQFFNFETVDASYIPHEHPAYQGVKYHFSQEVRQLDVSRQQSGRLPLAELNKDQYLIVWASFAWIIFLLVYPPLRRRLSFEIKFFILFLFVAEMCNAFVTGTMATIAQRYQSRVMWLMVFAALICLASVVKKEKIKSLAGSLF